MRVSLIKKDKITNFCFSEHIDGNYWIYDYDKNNKKRNLISITKNEKMWYLKSNNTVKILINGIANENVRIAYYQFYEIYIEKTKELYVLYFSPIFDYSFSQYHINNNINEINIGSNAMNTIICKLPKIAENHAKIIRQNNKYIIQCFVNDGMYINNINVQSKGIENGDIIFIMGLKIIIINETFIINNPLKSVSFSDNSFSNESVIQLNNIDTTESDEVELYEPDDYFFRAPRFVTKIEHTVVEIDPPPEPQEKDDRPFLYVVGPMLTMGIVSMMTGWNALSAVMDGSKTLGQAAPQLVMCMAMLSSMIMWPTLNRNYENKQKEKKDLESKKRYTQYIESKRKMINEILEWQKKTIIENNLSLKECEDIILNRKRSLWERKKDHDDFLNVTIGIGNVTPDIEIKYPEQHFSMVDSNLRLIMDNLIRDTQIIKDVPISFSLYEKNITAIVGNEFLTKQFIDGIILRLITFHSYEYIKLVILTNEKNSSKWEYLKLLPFTWNNDNSIRFFGTNSEDIMQITTYLHDILQKRIEENKENKNDNKRNIIVPYYIIITDDFYSIRNNEFIKTLLEQKNNNCGFSIMINNKKLLGLPDECNTFINIEQNISTMFESELVTEKQIEFKADIITPDINIKNCCLSLSNLPIIQESGEYLLPDNITFLELYNVGNIDQLNVISRWENSNPTGSLASPVGINKNGDILKIDLHEKFHGPHGLIAGMTGSGKSEFLITYILSLAINYSPKEVQFVLIDYKGGGLAGAFYNNESGIKLPHLCGVITNLDTVEIKRNFASIESELKRRQKLFAQAREQLNESTIDIYKYQKFYRDGLLKEPISHLFIISDEFAELKSQQPEFMDQLISIARIGRSLGVHLILATQKPSGVVNDQIWSNAKFKVCLRVQDRQDSMDMIKVPDAAMIKNTGRFFFQVGYNEYFTMGQAAYAGAQYYKTEKFKKTIDTSVNFIDNVGYTIKSVNDKNNKKLKSYGEELPNIVKYLSDLSNNLNIKVKPLWLEKIPAKIFVDALRKKYNYKESQFNIKPIIGEYDNPAKQEQNLVTIDVSNSNTIVYGMPGSGKIMVLNALIYSIITAHRTEEVNLYLIDYGAETLRIYNKVPQVGDIVLLGEEEKLDNLIKLINDEIAERKKIFVDYNGDYETYIKNSGKTLPIIVIVINNYEVFKDNAEKYDEDIQSMTRDGIRYGITFILTVSGVSGVRYKLQQNFSNLLSLQLANPSDFMSIFGKTGGITPSKIDGRGLVKYDSIYEFQTARFANDENMTQVINNICKTLIESNLPKAKKIPVLPNKVTYTELSEYISDLSRMPVGLYKENIQPALFNFKNKIVSMISGNDMDEIKSFILGLVESFTNTNGVSTIILDANELYEESVKQDKLVYYNDRFEEVFDKLIEIANKLKDTNATNMDYICIIYGLQNFKNKLSKEKQDKFDKLFESVKDIECFKYIIVDTIMNIKKEEYNTWYKNYVTNNEAVFVGNGLAQQFTIKLTKSPRYLNETLPEKFGYYIKQGVPYIVKLLEKE